MTIDLGFVEYGGFFRRPKVDGEGENLAGDVVAMQRDGRLGIIAGVVDLYVDTVGHDEILRLARVLDLTNDVAGQPFGGELSGDLGIERYYSIVGTKGGGHNAFGRLKRELVFVVG